MHMSCNFIRLSYNGIRITCPFPLNIPIMSNSYSCRLHVHRILIALPKQSPSMFIAFPHHVHFNCMSMWMTLTLPPFSFHGHFHSISNVNATFISLAFPVHVHRIVFSCVVMLCFHCMLLKSRCPFSFPLKYHCVFKTCSCLVHFHYITMSWSFRFCGLLTSICSRYFSYKVSFMTFACQSEFNACQSRSKLLTNSTSRQLHVEHNSSFIRNLHVSSIWTHL